MASLKRQDKAGDRLKRKEEVGNLNSKSLFTPMVLLSEMERSDLMRHLKISNS